MPRLLLLSGLSALACAHAAPRAAITPSICNLEVAYSQAASPRGSAGCVHFLEGEPDSARRAQLAELFLRAYALAQGFGEAPLAIREVRPLSPGANPHWTPGGVIELDPAGERGTLFHEMFHAVFHGSPLDFGDDQRWGDPFCDAFRYFAEAQLLPGETPWRARIDALRKLSLEQAVALAGDSKTLRDYWFPASRIVEKSGSLDGLRAMFHALSARRAREGQDLLDGEFDPALIRSPASLQR